MGELRHVTLGEHAYTIEVLGGDDPYSKGVHSGYGSDLYSLAKSQLPPGSIALDIGANIGLTAVILSQFTETTYAFEPASEIFPLLTRNVQRNGIGNLSIHQLAVGDRATTVHFDGNSAYGAVTTDTTAQPVQMVTLDGFVEQHDLGRLDMVKVDVEGFEPFVIEGSQKSLERFNPILLMEFNSWALMKNGRVNPHQFAESIIDNFQTVLFFEKTGGFTPVQSAHDIVARNVFADGCVSDLVLRRRAEPLRAPANELSPSMQSARVETLEEEVRRTSSMLADLDAKLRRTRQKLNESRVEMQRKNARISSLEAWQRSHPANLASRVMRRIRKGLSSVRS